MVVKQMNDFIQMISPYVLPLIIAAVGYAVTYLKVKKQDLVLNQLEEIIKNEGEHYYIICDKCGNKIQLSKAKLYADMVMDEEGNME